MYSSLKTRFSSMHTTLFSNRPMLYALLVGMVAFTSILAFAPIFPTLPRTGIDPSWALAMNQAVEQGSVFGQDIVFTFGPYSALYSRSYHPATYQSVLALGLIFGIGYALMLLKHIHLNGNNWLWSYAAVLLFASSTDALFFSYPLILMLATCRMAWDKQQAVNPEFINKPQWEYILQIMLLGALPLIKGSFIPMAAMAIMVGFVMHWLTGRRAYAISFIALPLFTTTLLWKLAGQPLADLPNYFKSIAPIISGFSEAMLIPGKKPWEIPSYLLLTCAIIATIITNKNLTKSQKITVTACVSAFLFISFKAGFVRHDRVHAVAAGYALILAVIVLNLFNFTSPRGRRAITVSAMIVWFAIQGGPLRATLINPIRHPDQVMTPLGAWKEAETIFQQHLDGIQDVSNIPLLAGTSDIYPYDQTEMIASRNEWFSRPIPQSYSVYTPELAIRNEAHLRKQKAPENIIIRVASIDNHFPTMDDGLTWPTFLSNYRVAATDDRYVYLRRRSEPLTLDRILVMQGTFKIEERISLPQAVTPLFAEFDVQPTLLGRLEKILFKPRTLLIHAELANGRSMAYRFIPGMAKTGFIISPLISSNSEFSQFISNQSPLLPNNSVKRIWISQQASLAPSWVQEYSLKITSLNPLNISNNP